jgi:outer membrane protein OmpA-like peptidoglycan-associated protein
MKKLLVLAVLIAVAFTGCAGMTKQGKGTAIGAASGAAVGALVSGSVWGVLAGAAIGGTAGNLIGKHMDKQAKELAQAVPTAEVQRVGEGINMTFDSKLMFDTGSASLNAGYQDDLAAAAGVFANYEDTNIVVEGHTDDTGTDAVNIPLSEKRAKTVSAFLESHGVAASRLQTKWYGSSKPKVPNDSAENRALNRRVELAIYANDEMVADAKAGTLQ